MRKSEWKPHEIQLWRKQHCLAAEVPMSVPGKFYFCSSVFMKTSKQNQLWTHKLNKIGGLKKPCSAECFYLGKPPYSTANSAVVIPIWGEAVNSSTAWSRILDLGELAESMGWLGNTCVHSSVHSVTLQQLWNNSHYFKAEGTVFWLMMFTQASWLFWYKEIAKECICFQCIGTQVCELGLWQCLWTVRLYR